MAEAQDSVTTVDEPTEQGQKKGRFGFGRRKDKGDDHTETEWVETLRAQEDEEPEEGPTASPFAAPEVPEPQPEADTSTAALPEAHAETEPLTREPAALSNGDSEEVYERSWTRRRHEEMDDIHHFVDNVLGTSLDPARRRRLMTQEVGLQNRPLERERSRSAVQVEGIDEELMIAFTFPEEEFRGARVVYETEGGYVLEVQRAIGNDDKRMTHQYYTVSRVGEVAHVLDKMRARGLEADHAALQRAAEADREVPEPEPGHDAAPVHDAEPVEPVAPPAPADDSTSEALPDTFHQPTEPDTETVSPAEPESVPEPPSTTEAPQIDVPPATAVPETEPTEPAEPAEPADAEETNKRRFGFGRKKSGADDDPQPQPPAEPDATGETEEGRKRRFGFGRKKTEGDEAGEPDAGEVDDSDAAKKRGIFRFKKEDDAGDDESA